MTCDSHFLSWRLIRKAGFIFLRQIRPTTLQGTKYSTAPRFIHSRLRVLANHDVQQPHANDVVGGYLRLTLGVMSDPKVCYTDMTTCLEAGSFVG